ncbi:hypothetical protein DL240_00735 [Lujinxingia litoralis]|uniref:Lipoprotein n=1 Tax=Lujinxingia litoralis TaxID=2211119 RepID=A0A328C9Z9_9DELT|nr:hypothetical protein [Lujinxingia litoralis]RAL24768.1 hypothetical protein DL240_00735 [Lujinxingia litoralis]
MRHPQRILTAAALLTSLTTASCGAPGDLCDERTSSMRWDDRDRYGERPRDYVDPHLDDYEVPGYDLDRDLPLTFDITLTRRDEPVLETQRFPIDGRARCDDLLEAPLRLRLQSTHARLDERLLATAEIIPTYPDDPLRVVARFDERDLDGDWRPRIPDGHALESLLLILDFDRAMVHGELLVESYDREYGETRRTQAFLIGSHAR